MQGVFPVSESSHIAAARAALGDLMARSAFDAERAGRGTLMLTEAATNILKHAGEGSLILNTLARNGTQGVEVIALDRGPGISDLAGSMVDGVSTAGTPGTGLGAMRRLSDEFDAYTGTSIGTAVRMSLWSKPAGGPPQPCELGAICIPKRGEEVCGDAWGASRHADGVTVMVADGLGHGLLAHEASREAVSLLETQGADAASRLLEDAHGRLRATRGAAIAIARCELPARRVTFAGAGNITGTFAGLGLRRSMVSHSGIVGHKIHSAREVAYDWPEHALLVMHSDGLESHWDLASYPGLTVRHPALIAAVLYRDFARGRDDVTVVVLRAGIRQ